MTQPAPNPTPAAPSPPPDVDIMVDGQAATVPRQDLQAALDAGAQLPTPPQAAAAAPAGGLMGTLDSLEAAEIGFGSNLLGGGIPGIIHSAAHQVDPEWAKAWGENYEAAKQKAEAEHGFAYGAGAMGGMVADAYGPIGKASNALGGLAKGAAGAGALGSIADLAVQGAFQQAVSNEGAQFSEAELGDHDLNAEKLFAAATDKSVLIAGGVGGALGAIGAGGSALLRSFRGKVPAGALDAATGVAKTGDAVAAGAREGEAFIADMQRLGKTSEQATGIASDLDQLMKRGTATQLLDETVEPWIKKHAAASADPVEFESLLRRQLTSGAESAIERNARFDTIARDLSSHGDDVLRKVVDNVDDVQFAQKRGQTEKLVDPDNWRGARDATLQVWQEAKAVVEKWEATASKGGAEGIISKSRKWLDDFAATNGGIGDIATQADKSKVAAELFGKLDEFKRQIAPGAKFGRGLAGQMSIDAASVASDFDGLYHSIRGVLEDEAIFGKAGAAQRENNAAVTNFIDKSGAFKQAFGAVTLEHAAGRPVLETDPGKFKAFLRSLGGAEGDKPRQILREYLDAAIQRRNAAAAHYEIPAKQLAEMDAGVEAARKMLAKLDGAEKEATQLAKLDQAIAGERSGGIGGVLGLAADAYTAPFRSMGRIAQIRRATQALDETVVSSLKSFLRGRPSSAPARLAAPRSDAALVREIESVRQQATNPGALVDRLDKATGREFQSAAPKHATALATTAARAIAYLASIAPRGRASLSLLPSDKTPLRYGRHELEQYERASAAVHNPQVVIAEASQGRLSREGVKAIWAVYPKLYAQMQDQVMQQLTTMDAKGDLDKMPYQRRILLGTLLQIPADSTQRPEVMAAIQKLKMAAPEQQQAQQKQGGGRRPIKLNTSEFQTHADSIEAGGVVR